MRNRLEIDDQTWQNTYEDQRDQYIRAGMWKDMACTLARELMDSVYIRRSAAMQCDTQKDYDEERQGDWAR